MSVNYKEQAEKLQGDIAKLQTLFPGDEFKQVCKGIDAYKGFIANKRLQVAVVGAVKAGKSTLLNAILGEDITSTEVTPETAALTIFRKAERNYLKVSFYNQEEWQRLWNDAAKDPESVFSKKYAELGADRERQNWVGQAPRQEDASDLEALKTQVKKFSSSRYPQHYFVKELEIGLQDYPLAGEISFVDTPGLNDTLEYRSNITKRYIDEANAVVVCISAKTMQNEELATLVKVFERIGENKAKVMVLGTQIDILNNPQEDWEKQKKVWFEDLRKLFKNDSLMEKNVLGVSAWVYSAARDLKRRKPLDDRAAWKIADFSEQRGAPLVSEGDMGSKTQRLFAEDKKIMREKAEAIQGCSAIPQFLEVLRNGPLGNPQKMLADEMEGNYRRLLEDAQGVARSLKKGVEEQLNLLNQDMAKREAAKKEKEQALKNMEGQEQSIKEQFAAIKRETDAHIKKVKDQLQAEIKQQLGGV